MEHQYSHASRGMTSRANAWGRFSTRPVSVKRIRYAIIACCCAASHNVIMIVGDYIGVGFVEASLVSFMFVTPAAYALHARFTFAERLSLTRFLRFALGVAVALPLSLLMMTILCTLAKLPMVVAAPIATLVLFVWNYVAAHLSIRGYIRQNEF
jgi:putative flippase GtrA